MKHQMEHVVRYELDIIHQIITIQDIHVQIHNEIMQVEIIIILEMGIDQTIVQRLLILMIVEQIDMNHQTEHVVQ
jgi:hypothetical protein